jgi:putative phosphoesterase
MGYKIAVIADVHSNIEALDAILKELDNMDIDDIVVAGDHIGDGPAPSLVLDILINRDVKVIRGNREDYVQSYLDGEHPDWDNHLQIAPMVWTSRNITDEQVEWIRRLPDQITFDTPYASVRVVHGSPRRTNELIKKDNIKLIEEALSTVDEDILICGHNHQRYNVKMNGTLIVNPGAAGLPFMKAGSAPYSIISYEDGVWSVEERCAYYDIDKLIKRFYESTLINCGAWTRAVIASLKSGKVVTITFLRYAIEVAKSHGFDTTRGLIPDEYWLEAEKTFDWEKY